MLQTSVEAVLQPHACFFLARKKQEKEEDERRQYEKLKKKFKGNKNGK